MRPDCRISPTDDNLKRKLSDGATIVHIQFKDTDTNEYYSSIKAVYQHHYAADIGLQHRSLVNALHDTNVYENKRVIVRRGKINSSTSKRTEKRESINNSTP